MGLPEIHARTLVDNDDWPLASGHLSYSLYIRRTVLRLRPTVHCAAFESPPSRLGLLFMFAGVGYCHDSRRLPAMNRFRIASANLCFFSKIFSPIAVIMHSDHLLP